MIMYMFTSIPRTPPDKRLSTTVLLKTLSSFFMIWQTWERPSTWLTHGGLPLST